jgi:hypothetical protein
MPGDDGSNGSRRIARGLARICERREEIDRPHRLSLRGRVFAGTILDTAYEIEADGDEAVLRMSKVAVGPMTDEQASSIRTYGDIGRFEDALRRVVEG